MTEHRYATGGNADKAVPSLRSLPRLQVRCSECEGWDATNIDCPHGCGVRLIAGPQGGKDG